jgi:hypothetical protein
MTSWENTPYDSRDSELVGRGPYIAFAQNRFLPRVFSQRALVIWIHDKMVAVILESLQPGSYGTQPLVRRLTVVCPATGIACCHYA